MNIYHKIGTQHFCKDPHIAVCGVDLSANDFDLFYKATTNSFKNVTCVDCRSWLTKEYFFQPGGFPAPEEWISKI